MRKQVNDIKMSGNQTFNKALLDNISMINSIFGFNEESQQSYSDLKLNFIDWQLKVLKQSNKRD